MLNSRRQLCRSAVPFLALLSFPSLLESQRPLPQPVPSPNAPNPNFPQGMNGPGPKGPDPKAINKQNMEQLRVDVDKLFALASDLKQELSATNAADVLSVTFVKNAKQIEKLAKQIRDLAQG